MSQTVPGIPQLLGAIQPDAVVAARYTLLAPIDEGGCGQVWRALQQDNPTLVAIKFPRPDLGADQRERFASELQILKHLPKHPHLVQLLDEGVFEGQPFLVMEYFPKTLSAWLNEHQAARRLPDLFTVYRLFAQICDAVGAAHRLAIPIIHRDINPRNIMLYEDPLQGLSAKVLDFGIGRIGKRLHTQTGECIGTPGYMSPEQLSGDAEHVGTSSDVFSLGVLAYVMLCLEHPLTGANTHRKDVPGQIWDVIATATNPQRALRYNDARALRTAWLNSIEFVYNITSHELASAMTQATKERASLSQAGSDGVVAMQMEEQETEKIRQEVTKITAQPIEPAAVTVRSSSSPKLLWDVQRMRLWWKRFHDSA